MRIGRPGLVTAGAAVLVTGLVVWGAEDQLDTGADRTAADRLVPEDGTRAVSRAADGRLSVTEDARLSGVETVLTTPPVVGNALVDSLDGDPLRWRMWRHTTTTYAVAEGGSGEQSTSLYRLTEDGVEQVAAYGASTLVFDPPVLALPADVGAGASWDGSGAASTDGSLTYELEASAEPADLADGCLRVSGTLALARDGAALTDLAVDETWCPGGPLRLDDDVPGDPPATDGDTAPQVGLASGAEDWVAHPRPLTVATSLEEAGEQDPPMSVTVDFAPAGSGAGALTVPNATTGDLFGFVPQGDRLVRAWVGHPGGDVTAVATSGDVSVVGTSRRELVGYGARGQWLWSTDLGGVPVVSPLAADEDHLVAATVAGDVVVLDPATGEVAWSDRMTDAVRRAPVTDGDTVVAVDTAGHVAAWDLDSGDRLWSDEIDDGRALAVSGTVLAVRGGGSVVGHDLDSGERLWSTRTGFTEVGATLVATGRTFVVADGEQTVGLDRASGEVRWERAGAPLSTGLDGRLVQLSDDDELLVRDDDGDLIARVDLEGLDPGTRWVSPADAGVWVADVSGHVLEVSP